MLSDSQRAILTAVCDTVVPSLPRDRDPDGLWGRKASDLGVDVGAAQLISEIPDPELRGGLAAADRRARRPGDHPRALPGVPRADPAQHRALRSAGGRRRRGADRDDPLPPLRRARSRRPARTQLGDLRVPGADLGAAADREAAEDPRARRAPRRRSRPTSASSAPAPAGRSSRPCSPSAGWTSSSSRRPATTTSPTSPSSSCPPTSRCSGAAARRRPPTGNVSLVAGTTLGGGTTINWTNCLRTTALGPRAVGRAWARRAWTSSEFDRHLDAVLERISANDSLQRPERDAAAAARGDGGARLELRDDRAQHRSRTPTRRRRPAIWASATSPGSKQSADRTWLADAQEHGARFLTFTRATRVLTEGGRAAGVEAVWQTPDGRGAQVTVRAPRVVVACGSLESPALLLRSGIGGPAVGHNLRLHPSTRRRRRLRHRPAGLVGRAAGRASATSSRTPARATAS